MSASRPHSTVVVAVLVLAVAATAAATGVVTADGGSDAEPVLTGDSTADRQDAVADESRLPESASVVDVNADRTVTWIDLHADGDATFTVEYWIRLDTEEEETAFRSLDEDIEADPANYTERFGDRMSSTAEAAGETTGREMGVHDVTVDAEVRDLGTTRYGVVTYSFEWTNFAIENDDTIRAGDAIEGMFLEEGTELVIRWPDEYELDEVRPTADEELSDDNRVGWAGRTDFGPDEPHVVVSAAGSDGVAVAQPVGLLALLFVLGLAAAAGAAWYRRRHAPGVGSTAGDEDSGEPAGGPAGNGASEVSEAGDGRVPGVSGSPATGDGAGTEAAEGPRVGDPGDESEASPDRGTTPSSTEPPEELLSNEERVMKFVRERGGRVKQQEIVKTFGWTDAKTSQVVRELRDEGELDGFRLGRENVLHLPGQETDPQGGGERTDSSDGDETD